MNASELKPGLKKIEITLKILEKSESRQVALPSDGQYHQVCDALAGDETGCIYLSLWDENALNVKEGKHYKISNAYTSVYRNSLRLNTGKYGRIAETDADFEANTSNNMSLKEL